MPETYDTIQIPFRNNTPKVVTKDTINPFLTYEHPSCADSATSKIIYRKSLFTYHSLRKISPEAKPKPVEPSNGWIFGLLIGIVLLFGFLLRNYNSKLTEVIRSCFSNRFLNFLLKESIILKRTIVPLVYIGFLFIVSLYILHLIIFTGSPFLFPQFSIYVNFIILFVGINLVLFLRIWVIKFLGNVFNSKKSTDLFLLNDFNFTYLTCIFLLPILFVCFFSDAAMVQNITKISIGIISVLYVFKILRSFNIALLQNRLSKLYLFYYLCSLEIIPILVIGKILISF